MNTNTNKNTVNKPEGARRPVSPNQTVEEQKHNAQINNINNNMEDDNMDNNKIVYDCDNEMNSIFEQTNEQPKQDNIQQTNNNEFKIYTNALTANETTLDALELEVFQQLYKGIDKGYLRTNGTIYFNIGKEGLNLDVLTVALVGRAREEKIYGEITFYGVDQNTGETGIVYNQEGKPVRNLPTVRNTSIIRRVFNNNELPSFFKKFVDKDYVKAHTKMLVIDSLSDNIKREVIIFGLEENMKKALENQISGAEFADKIGDPISGIANKATGFVEHFTQEHLKETSKAVAGLAAETALGVGVITTTAAKEISNRFAAAAKRSIINTARDEEFQQGLEDWKFVGKALKTIITKGKDNNKDNRDWC